MADGLRADVLSTTVAPVSGTGVGNRPGASVVAAAPDERGNPPQH